MEQQIQQPIQEQTKNKPLTKTSWIFIVIVAVLGLLVGGGMLWYGNLSPQSPLSTPTPDKQPTINNQQSTIDTSDWQTYRNDEFGFEVRYPERWSFRLTSQTFVPPLKSFFAIQNSKDSDQWIQIEAGEEMSDAISQSDPLSDKKIGGLRAHKFFVSPLSPALGMPPPGNEFEVPSFPALWVERGGRFYILVFYGTESIKGAYDQILSTFRFVE